MKRLLPFSKNYLKMVYLRKKKQSNIMMKRQRHFLPIAISPAPALYVPMKMLMVINAKNVAVVYLRNN